MSHSFLKDISPLPTILLSLSGSLILLQDHLGGVTSPSLPVKLPTSPLPPTCVTFVIKPQRSNLLFQNTGDKGEINFLVHFVAVNRAGPDPRGLKTDIKQIR